MPFGLRAAVCKTYPADERGISRFPNMTFPCVHGVSDHGEPLQASRLTARSVWASFYRGWRRHSQCGLFEIPYPARSFPCQRFDLALRFRRMTRGRMVRYLLPRRGLSPLDVMPVSTGGRVEERRGGRVGLVRLDRFRSFELVSPSSGPSSPFPPSARRTVLEDF